MWPKHAGIICTSTLDTDGSHEISSKVQRICADIYKTDGWTSGDHKR